MAMLLGRATIRLNGRTLRTNEGASIDLGGEEKNTKMGSSRVNGYTVKAKQSIIECEISVAVGESVEDLRNVTNATVVFETDSGHIYVIREAEQMLSIKITEGDGGAIPLRFEGQPAEVV